MLKESNFIYREIPVLLEKQVLHIENAEALHTLMKSGRSALYALTDELLHEHEKRFGESLRISRKSLTVEIRWHYLLYRMAIRLPAPLQKNAFVAKGLRSTRNIDCGAKNLDGNRFFWDLLAVLEREPEKS